MLNQSRRVTFKISAVSDPDRISIGYCILRMLLDTAVYRKAVQLSQRLCLNESIRLRAQYDERVPFRDGN
jgi:hypothetical protein